MLAILTFFNVCLYYSYAYLHLWGRGIIPVKPLYWYLFTITTSLILIIFRRGLRIPPPPSTRLILWGCTFLALSAASFIFVSKADKVALQTLITYAEAVSLLTIFVLAFQDAKVAHYATIAMLTVVILSVLLNYVDFISHGRAHFSPISGRAAGMYENPNISGQYLVLGMALSAAILPKAWRWPFCVFAFSGVVLTFSRASIMLWGVAVFALAWTNVFMLPRRISILILSLILVVSAAALLAGDWVGIFKSTGLGRYLDQNTIGRISGSFFDQKDFSTESRLYVAKKGLHLYLSAPMFGHGIGSTYEWNTGVSTHNTFLQIAAEQGTVGILIMVGLLWTLWTGGSSVSRMIAILFAFGSLFSHNNLEQPAMEVALALAIVAGNSERQRIPRRQAVARRADLQPDHADSGAPGQNAVGRT